MRRGLAARNFSLVLFGAIGTFQTPATLSNVNAASSIVLGDFNGDGRVDIAATGANGLYILLGTR
jgi:hypothetical protein